MAIGEALGQELIVTNLLREQDLGWREGRSFKNGDKAAFGNAAAMREDPGESKLDMDSRAEIFIKEYLSASIAELTDGLKVDDHKADAEPVFIVVSHGLFLLRLYNKLVTHFKISLPPAASWSNTGWTEFLLKPNLTTVTNVNSVQHLQGLKRTRAGVGSSQYDKKQRKVSDFFGKRIPGPLTIPDTIASEKSTASSTMPTNAVLTMDDEDVDLEAAIKAIDAACRD